VRYGHSNGYTLSQILFDTCGKIHSWKKYIISSMNIDNIDKVKGKMIVKTVLLSCHLTGNGPQPSPSG